MFGVALKLGGASLDSSTNLDKRHLKKPRTNVISMKLDASYFYERGLKFLENGNLKKALKAFRKTVEYDPQNPVNHCNLAGVLSELGDFSASNDVLHHVLQDLDPMMAECQFYLANNYANMGEYVAAEEHVLRYLECDPDGEYVDDAEDMLIVLMDEFGGGQAYEVWTAKRALEEQEAAKRDGRHLLENGQFEAAVEWLEDMVNQEVDNIAPRNNLSLAYYYTGQYHHAIDMAQSVLEQQPDNLHALCNLAVFTSQMTDKELHVQCVELLKKLFPLHYDHAMKLGTTLGLIGDHAAALNVFSRLVRMVDLPESVLLHSVAASAANAGYLQVASKWWKVMRQRPEMEEVASYYLMQVEHCVRHGLPVFCVSYQYDLPLQIQFAQMKKRLNEGNISTWRQDPLLRASLYWGLRHGNLQIRKAVIRTLSLIADEDAQKSLKLFLKRTDIDSSLQSAALFALQRGGARGRVEYWEDGELVSHQMSEISKDVILGVDPVWAQIWSGVEDWLRENHLTRHLAELQRIWISFLNYTFTRKDVRMGKIEIWMAGLLYAGLKHADKAVSQRDLAERFKVSASSISKVASRLEPYFVRMP